MKETKGKKKAKLPKTNAAQPSLKGLERTGGSGPKPKAG
jgi:hypothetical protein